MRSKSLNIAMVVASPYPANHGTPGSIREMAEAVYRLGHKVHIVTYPYGEDNLNIKPNGIKVHRVSGIKSGNNIKVGPSYEKIYLDTLLAKKLCQVVREEKIDIIHAHNYEGAIAGYVAKKFTGVPLVYNAINTMIDELHTYNFIRPQAAAKGFARILDYTVPRTADSVLAISDELVRFLLSKKVLASKIARIPLGVNFSMFNGKDPLLMRKKYGIGNKPLIVYTGILNEFQRVDYLLNAMKVVVNQIEDAVLLIVPNLIDKADLQRHQALARELNIEKNVIFTDPRPFSEVPYFLASADVTVLPRPECPGFPVKLLNYMAAGKPIVAFKGSSKGLENMENAILADDHSWEQMGDGILKILSDSSLAKTLGNNAKEYAIHAYGWENIAKGIEKTYLNALTQRQHKETKTSSDDLSPYKYQDRRQIKIPTAVGERRRRADRRLQNIYLYLPEKRGVLQPA